MNYQAINKIRMMRVESEQNRARKREEAEHKMRAEDEGRLRKTDKRRIEEENRMIDDILNRHSGIVFDIWPGLEYSTVEERRQFLSEWRDFCLRNPNLIN